MTKKNNNDIGSGTEYDDYRSMLDRREKGAVGTANQTSDNMIAFMGTASALFITLLTIGGTGTDDSASLRIIFFVATCIFSASIVMGVVYHLLSHEHHFSAAKDFNTIATDLKKDERGEDDEAYHRATVLRDKYKRPIEAGRRARIAQAILFIAGIVATLLYVGLATFSPVCGDVQYEHQSQKHTHSREIKQERKNGRKNIF